MINKATGTEHFTINGKDMETTISDFWRWAYSDLLNNINRSVLAEFIVVSALGITDIESEQIRQMWGPYDLLSKDGFKIEVKCAAYIQSWDCKHPDHISYSIAPARLPDETGDYKIDAPLQRNSDIYVFCLYKAMKKEEFPLNLDLWEFYILSTNTLDKKKPAQKTISLPSLLQLNPLKCDYDGIKEAIQAVMNA